MAPCFICDHTMDEIGLRAENETIYWCSRCGALRFSHLTIENHHPRLVDHCREYPKQAYVDLQMWQKLGISESINLPDARPK